jgi:nitrile hydratase
MLTAGTMVRVRADWPEFAAPAHIRTPHYVRGRTGEVVRHLGTFRNPEDLAFARPAAMRELYHVRFDGSSLWGDAREGASAADDVVVEIFDHWLEVAPE